MSERFCQNRSITDELGETARSYRLFTQPPIDIGEETALVCKLPTAING